MATRKRTVKLPGQKKPADGAANRMVVLLEQIQEQNRATIEAVTSTAGLLRQEIADLRRDLTLRIEALEVAVRKNSEDIRRYSEDIQRMKEQLAELTDAVRGKIDRAAFDALESRVARLESRLA